MTTLNHHELARGALRAMRNRTRQRFREARPAVTPEIKIQVGRWKALIEADQKAGRISKGAHVYAFNLLTVASVVRGQWCLYSDPSMGERINLSARTIRRHRKELVDAGRLESLDGRKRHQTCMVRPILPDGAVFALPKKTDSSATSGRPGRPILADDLLLTASSNSYPQTPIAQDNAPEKIIGRPLVAADVVSSPQPEPPPTPTGQGLGNDDVAPAEITFAEVWAASDKVGPDTFAERMFDKLDPVGRASLGKSIRRNAGRWLTGKNWVGKMIEKRRWPTLDAVPTTAADIGVWVVADSQAGLAWQRYWKERRMPGLAPNKRGHFVKRLLSEWPPKPGQPGYKPLPSEWPPKD